MTSTPPPPPEGEQGVAHQQHLGQEQEQEQKEGFAGTQDSIAAEAQNEFYDPNNYENYSYDPEDGNYYYYPAQENGEKTDASAAGDLPVSADSLIRTYEFDDWEPKSYGWFADVVLETFISKMFRIYLAILLFSAGGLLLSLSMTWTFQILFRLYMPPKRDRNADWQAISYLVIFLYLSFTIVTAFCMWLHLIKGIWNVKREDTAFWGMTHGYCFSRKTPPYIVYFFLIIVTAVFPLLYTFIATLSKNQTFSHFVQEYAYISVITTECLLLFWYCWFYLRSLREKVSAVKKCEKRDEFTLWKKALKQKKTIKKRWYHASTILEEFGLDGKTLWWNVVVFTIGCVPLFSLIAGYRLIITINESPVIWGALGCIALSSIYVVAWMTLLRTRSHWSIFTSLTLIVFFFILGLVGSAVSASQEAAGAVIVLFIACQGMLTRKRSHELTLREQCALFNANIDGEMQHVARRRRIDTYLCCCRDLFLRCVRCCDVKTFFGYPHPDVTAAQKKYAVDRISLLTDQKALMFWWLFLMITMAFVIGVGNNMAYRFTGPIAQTSYESLTGTYPKVSMCQMRFNANGSVPLGLYDLTLLSALSYTFAENGDIDFSTWFHDVPNFVRRYPVHLPPTLEHATKGIDIPFSDYVDLVHDFHFITLNSNNRGMPFMRSVEEWSSSLAVQLADVMSPLNRLWSDEHRVELVRGISFVQRMFPYTSPLDNVSSYIQELVSGGNSERILLIGDGFNGGYAKMLSSIYNVPFVVFNSPGTRYKLSMQMQGIQVSFTGSTISSIDSLEGTLETFHLECDEWNYSTECDKIQTIVKKVAMICGDPNGRKIK